MSVWLVTYWGLAQSCPECGGGGDCELLVVTAPDRETALRLAEEHLRRLHYDDPWAPILGAERLCVRLRRSRHRQARVLSAEERVVELGGWRP